MIKNDRNKLVDEYTNDRESTLEQYQQFQNQLDAVEGRISSLKETKDNLQRRLSSAISLIQYIDQKLQALGVNPDALGQPLPPEAGSDVAEEELEESEETEKDDD